MYIQSQVLELTDLRKDSNSILSYMLSTYLYDLLDVMSYTPTTSSVIIKGDGNVINFIILSKFCYLCIITIFQVRICLRSSTLVVNDQGLILENSFYNSYL